jgi:hypothetical protein
MKKSVRGGQKIVFTKIMWTQALRGFSLLANRVAKSGKDTSNINILTDFSRQFGRFFY